MDYRKEFEKETGKNSICEYSFDTACGEYDNPEYVEYLESKLREREWINVKDRLPTDENYVLALTDNEIFENCYRLDLKRWNRKNDLVTHWMYKPLPPKQ